MLKTSTAKRIYLAILSCLCTLFIAFGVMFSMPLKANANAETVTWTLGDGATEADGTYTVAGAGAMITTEKQYSEFILEYEIVENAVNADGDTHCWGPVIRMGNVTKTASGEEMNASQLDFYLPSGNASLNTQVWYPLYLYDGPYGSSSHYAYDTEYYPAANSPMWTSINKTAGNRIRLTVTAGSMTLAGCWAGDTEWEDIQTYTNEYVIGTKGTISIGIPKLGAAGGTYSIKNITITDLNPEEEPEVETAKWTLGDGATEADGTYTVAGAGAMITTEKQYSEFILEYEIVENAVNADGDTHCWGPVIRMGNVTKTASGEEMNASQLDFYLPSGNASLNTQVWYPLYLYDGPYGSSSHYAYDTEYYPAAKGPMWTSINKTAGNRIRLTVTAGSMTLAGCWAGDTEWEDIQTYTNEYVIGTKGTISIGIPKLGAAGGTYSVKNITITDLNPEEEPPVEDTSITITTDSPYTTTETYTEFEMTWTVVSNTTLFNNDTMTQGVAITMGSTGIDWTGYNFEASLGKQPVSLYLASTQWPAAIYQMFIPGVGSADPSTAISSGNGAGAQYKLLVQGTTVTLYVMDGGEYVQLYTYTNEYIVATEGVISISVVKSGEYVIDDLVITSLATEEPPVEPPVDTSITITTDAPYTTTETYTSFEMTWTVVSNTTTYNNDTQTRGVVITMGNVTKDHTGYAWGGSTQLRYYMPSSQWPGVRAPFELSGVGMPDSDNYTGYGNGAGAQFKLVVEGTTLTLYSKTEADAEYTLIYTYTNEYVIGTEGTISIGIVNSGEYVIDDLVITSLVVDTSITITTDAPYTTTETYTSFEMTWTVVSNTTLFNNDTQTRGVVITMGNVTKDHTGYAWGGSTQLRYYMPSSQWPGVRAPFELSGVGMPDSDNYTEYSNGAGAQFKLVVEGTTLTLYSKTEADAEYTLIYTYTNEYVIGTEGTISIGIVNSGEYVIDDLVIIGLAETAFGQKTVYVNANGEIEKTAGEDTTKITLELLYKHGASIRLNATTSGIRFTGLIHADTYDALTALGADVTLGMLIAYVDLIDGNLDFDDAQKANVLLDKSQSWYEETIKGVRYYAWNVAITGISVENYDRDMIARVYMTIEYADNSTETIFGLVEEEGGNVRSIQTVARMALNDPTEDWTTDELSILYGYAGEGYEVAPNMVNDVFPVVTYVGPTGAYNCAYTGTTVESLIQPEVFATLADAGINLICGHGESEAQMELFLEYCFDNGMVYLPRCDLYGYARWDSTQNKILTYEDYSQEEKDAVDAAFRAYLKKWSSYPGFGGITAGDETGLLVVPAYARMKEVFDEMCPGRFFYLNMFGPGAGDEIYDLHRLYSPFTSEASEAGLTAADGASTWASVMDAYAHEVGLDVMSFDNYLFANETMAKFLFTDIDNFTTAINDDTKAMWYFVMSGMEAGVAREQTIYESYYQINASLTMGIQGIALYPGFSPIECSDKDMNNLYDRETGEPTEYMTWYKEIFTQIHACEEVLMNATYEGTMYHTATFGNSPSKLEFDTLSSFNHLTKISAGSGDSVVVGCYTWEGYDVLWVFNNASNNNTATPTLTFSESMDYVIIDGGVQSSGSGSSLKLSSMNGGEAVMIVLGTNTLDINN